MTETLVEADDDSRPWLERVETVEMRLLARWLLHCHARTRQRGQLGALASTLGDAEHERIDTSGKRCEPALV